MFKSRLDMIAYVISSLTNVPIDKCSKEALQYEEKPFIVKFTCDM